MTVTAKLESLLHEWEAEIVERWHARLSQACGSRSGQADDAPLHTRAELSEALRTVSRGTASAAVGLAVGLARIELRRPGARRNAADSVFALLVGRDCARQVLAE